MDVLLKGLPDGMTVKEIADWVSIYVERKLTATKKAELDAVIEPIKVTVDTYRKANELTPKFEAVAEPVEPKEV